jgi:hypothetical protein
MTGSVEIMLSYDYNHFKIALSSDKEMTLQEIDGMRKSAQRLIDKAVEQYKLSKKYAAMRMQSQFEKQAFIERIKQIKAKLEEDRTIKEMAELKQYQDEQWELQFDYNYDYEDDKT